MEKVIYLNKNMAELCKSYPELKQIMANLGFKDIMKPLALQSMGRIMTIPKGAATKEIPMKKIVEVLKQNGFQMLHEPDDMEYTDKNSEPAIVTAQLNEKEILLKGYIQRLTGG
jgi:hypothetical protein